MKNRRLRHLPVMGEKDELEGLISIGDVTMSQSNPDLRLEGLPHISEIVGDWLDKTQRPHFSVVESTS